MTPISIVMDCDPGHDDAIAIMLALASPELELVGITTVYGNQTLDKTTANAVRVLDVVDRSDVPVHAGVDRPLVRELFVADYVHGESGLDGPRLPPPSRSPGDLHAVDYLAREIRRRDGRLTLVPTGPLTNIALLLALAPDARPERIVLMGGAIGEGNRTPAAEFNIWCDPEAAAMVFEAGFRKITLVPLDATHRALVTREDCRRLAALGTPAATATAKFTHHRIDIHDQIQRMDSPGSAPVHDALCVASLIEPSVISTRKLHVAVETTGALTVGRTVIDTHSRSLSAPNCDVAFDADPRRFMDLLLDTFAPR